LKKVLRHLSSFIAPLLLCFVFPYLIVLRSVNQYSRPVFSASLGLIILGGLVSLAGLALLVLTIRMFILIGQGTIMPWDPTRRLITTSLYGYVRNPMILGVLTVEVGEAILFASWGIFFLAVIFFVINTVYFIYSEEPGLEKRFGAEYVEYKQNVPRWIPRIRPWHPE
jgi:protein-S-isoprenylcysteine O-methyltransferase Ste14